MKYIISFTFALVLSIGALVAQDQVQAPDFKHHSTKKEKKVLKKTSLKSKIAVNKKIKNIEPALTGIMHNQKDWIINE